MPSRAVASPAAGASSERCCGGIGAHLSRGNFLAAASRRRSHRDPGPAHLAPRTDPAGGSLHRLQRRGSLFQPWTRGRTASSPSGSVTVKRAVRVLCALRVIRVQGAARALVVASLVAGSWLLFAPSPADAQYFGRNQVRWEQFDFHQLETEHFTVYHYPAGNPAAADAARMAERWYDRLSTAFGHDFAEKKPIILSNNHPDFQQTALSGGELIGEGTGGFTEPYRDRVVLPLTADYADTDHVLGHELVHVFQFDIAQRMRPMAQQGSSTRAVGLDRRPLWMVEGLAESLSQGRNDTLTGS